MKKRITVTIDEDVYDALQGLPRRISVSELANSLFRVFLRRHEEGIQAYLEGYKEGLGFKEEMDFIEWVRKDDAASREFKEQMIKMFGESFVKFITKKIAEVSKKSKEKSKEGK